MNALCGFLLSGCADKNVTLPFYIRAPIFCHAGSDHIALFPGKIISRRGT